jgi:hypothetical protein
VLVEVMMIGIGEKYDVKRKERKDCGKCMSQKASRQKKEIVSYEKCLYESAIFFCLLLLKPLNESMEESESRERERKSKRNE